MKKVIFLDFDGVMTSGKNYDALVSAGKPVSDEYGDLLDPEAVANLQMILEKGYVEKARTARKNCRCCRRGRIGGF